MVAEEEFIGQIFDDGLNAVLGYTAQISEHAQRLASSHLLDGGVKLGTITQATLNVLNAAPDAVTVQIGVTVRDVNVTGQHLEGGRLAGSVDAQQTETLAASHAQAQVIHGAESMVVVLDQIPSWANTNAR